MPRGGSRKHSADCKCGKCPHVGRKRQERPTNANVATRILARVKAEETWVQMVDLEKRRLGLDGHKPEGKAVDSGDYQGKFSIIPLTSLLRYLEDRAYGKPVDTVNHLHDKPIDLNVNLSLAEVVREVRQRKESYERSRN